MSAAPRTQAGLWDLMKREGMEPTTPRPKERKHYDNEESRAQKGVIDWWDVNHARLGCPQCALFAVPNGGVRGVITATNLKREGVRRGTSDLILMVKRGPYGALCIEMKAPDGDVTPEQRVFLAAMAEGGYKPAVCYSTASAMETITNYLKL